MQLNKRDHIYLPKWVDTKEQPHAAGYYYVIAITKYRKVALSQEYRGVPVGYIAEDEAIELIDSTVSHEPRVVFKTLKKRDINGRVDIIGTSTDERFIPSVNKTIEGSAEYARELDEEHKRFVRLIEHIRYRASKLDPATNK